MASNTCSCQDCGSKIIGMKYTHNGKNYCYACYKKLQDLLVEQENQKQALYKYIKELFGIAEIPTEVLSFIDRELSNGKKIKGMEHTLRYYYEIEGHSPSSVNNIIYIIMNQYEAAKNYAINNKKLQKQNAAVDLNVPPVVVKIDPRNLVSRAQKKKYKMEDL